MTVTHRLVLPYPPSANEYWRPAPGRGLVPSDKAEAYKVAVRERYQHLQPLFGDVVLSGVVYRPQRSGDLGNRLKVLEDALQGVAFLDDEQVVAYADFRRAPEPDRANPRVELLLEGERFATPQEALTHAQAAAERKAKARKTRNENRRKKLAGEPQQGKATKKGRALADLVRELAKPASYPARVRACARCSRPAFTSSPWCLTHAPAGSLP